ncbi:hypothetical protein ACS0TY_001821 [Phlomoides rotata]
MHILQDCFRSKRKARSPPPVILRRWQTATPGPSSQARTAVEMGGRHNNDGDMVILGAAAVAVAAADQAGDSGAGDGGGGCSGGGDGGCGGG